MPRQLGWYLHLTSRSREPFQTKDDELELFGPRTIRDIYCTQSCRSPGCMVACRCRTLELQPPPTPAFRGGKSTGTGTLCFLSDRHPASANSSTLRATGIVICCRPELLHPL